MAKLTERQKRKKTHMSYGQVETRCGTWIAEHSERERLIKSRWSDVPLILDAEEIKVSTN